MQNNENPAQETFEQDLGPNEWPVPNFDDAPSAAELDALDDLACAGAFETTKAPGPTAHDHVGCMTFVGATTTCDKAKGGCGQVWNVGKTNRGQTTWVAEGQEV